MTLFGGVIPVTGISFVLMCVFGILFVGYALGRITIKGVSLGDAGVFVIALVFGAVFFFIFERNASLAGLSTGERQRVAIARSLVNNPDVIIADEPTGNLDGKSGREVLSLLKYVSKQLGVTLILVTHDLNVAEQAERILTIEDGKIVKDTKDGVM